MQETVKLISSSDFRKGQINSLPDVGDVKFDENGIVEVPTEFGQLLVDLIPDLTFLEGNEEKEKIEKHETPLEPLKPQIQEEDLNKSTDKDSLEPQTEENNILGSTEPNVASEEEAIVEQVEKATEEAVDGVQLTPEEIKAKLELKSATELREMISKIDPNVTVKNKNEAIQYLVAKLS